MSEYTTTITRPAPVWTEINGWLSPREGEALQSLVTGLRVLELGAYMGRSTVCLAQAAKLVVSVDWHKGDNDVGPVDTLGSFFSAIAWHGVRDKVIPIVGDIALVGPLLADGTFDLAFIDDDHHEGVIRSTRLAQRVVRPGGIIVWHDWLETQDSIVACGLMPFMRKEKLVWMFN